LRFFNVPEYRRRNYKFQNFASLSIRQKRHRDPRRLLRRMGPRKAHMMNSWSERQVRNLVYVGITRARHRLIIPYVTETEIISELRRYL